MKTTNSSPITSKLQSGLRQNYVGCQTNKIDMDYVIQLLEKERKMLEYTLREEDLMHKNMNQATQNLKKIAEIKRAVKVLKVKINRS